MIIIEEKPLIKTLEYDTILKEYVVFRRFEKDATWFKTLSEAKQFYDRV